MTGAGHPARLCAQGAGGWCAVVHTNAFSALTVCGVGINVPAYDHREPDCPDCVHVLTALASRGPGVGRAEEVAGTVDERDIGHDREDLKGLTGNDRYPEGHGVPEGGGRSHGATRRDPHGSGRFIPGKTAARFWAKVDAQPGGCWIWTGGLTDDGYGRFRLTVGYVKAHRWAYEHLVAPIRVGWTLDHLIAPGGPCTSRACVRPDHLEEVTRAENARRAIARRRATTANPTKSTPTALPRAAERPSPTGGSR